jgi:hypothetical protein
VLRSSFAAVFLFATLLACSISFSVSGKQLLRLPVPLHSDRPSPPYKGRILGNKEGFQSAADGDTTTCTFGEKARAGPARGQEERLLTLPSRNNSEALG